MLTTFYFKTENIENELNNLGISKREKSDLLKLAAEIAEYRLIDLLIDQLEKEDKKLFLEQLHSGSAELFIEFLRKKIENVESLLVEHSKLLEIEILEDIKNLRKDK